MSTEQRKRQNQRTNCERSFIWCLLKIMCYWKVLTIAIDPCSFVVCLRVGSVLGCCLVVPVLGTVGRLHTNFSRAHHIKPNCFKYLSSICPEHTDSLLTYIFGTVNLGHGVSVFDRSSRSHRTKRTWSGEVEKENIVNKRFTKIAIHFCVAVSRTRSGYMAKATS